MKRVQVPVENARTGYIGFVYFPVDSKIINGIEQVSARVAGLDVAGFCTATVYLGSQPAYSAEDVFVSTAGVLAAWRGTEKMYFDLLERCEAEQAERSSWRTAYAIVNAAGRFFVRVEADKSNVIAESRVFAVKDLEALH